MQRQPAEDFIKYRESTFLLKRRYLLYNRCYCSRAIDSTVHLQLLFLKAQRFLHICTIVNVHIRIQSHTGTMSPNGPQSGPDGEDYSSSTDKNAHPNRVCTFFVGVSCWKRFFFFFFAGRGSARALLSPFNEVRTHGWSVKWLHHCTPCFLHNREMQQLYNNPPFGAKLLLEVVIH